MDDCMPGCGLHTDGHDLDQDRATRAGHAPWGWRDAVVMGVDGHHIHLSYPFDGGGAHVWQHVHLGDDAVPNGGPARLHEEHQVLSTPLGWFNVRVVSGAGPVPTPDDTLAWEHAKTQTLIWEKWGVGVPIDWPEPLPGL